MSNPDLFNEDEDDGPLYDFLSHTDVILIDAQGAEWPVTVWGQPNDQLLDSALAESERLEGTEPLWRPVHPLTIKEG